jgi:histone deacetylase 11
MHFRNLEESLREFHPDILVYNAGTDVLDGDTLGLLAISAQVSKQYKI